MKYKEAIDWLFTQLPMFQKTGGTAYHPGLDNIKALLAELKNPHLGLKCIHIAGTNGKGSTSHMLASIFQEAGYKTGLYTSPHLKNFEERVRINGKEISKKSVIDFTEKMQLSKAKPSFFEMTVALAFDQFKAQKVDIAIIETGMGGRLDSTNIIKPILSIITNISWDHQQYLGDTLAKIAFEKAGIIKQNTPVVVGETTVETKTVFEEKANECQSNIYFAEDMKFEKAYHSDLKGSYQIKNIKTVQTALMVLKENGYYFSTDIVTKAMLNVQENTGLKGRYQVLSLAPKIIADTGHNLAAMEYLIPQILSETYQKLHIVLGMASDKDRNSILKLMPKNAQYYFCKPNVPRGCEVIILKEEANNLGLQGEKYDSVNLALTAAKSQAAKEDLIFIGGSTFVVAEVV